MMRRNAKTRVWERCVLGWFGWLLLMASSGGAFGQSESTRDDELRGKLSAERRCYDVTEYHLTVRIDPENREISGANRIVFDVVEDCERLQVDLFGNLSCDGIRLGDEVAKFTREANSIFVTLPRKLHQGETGELTIRYSGSPIVAQRPPWNGGFTWETDPDGNPWVVVTSQGTGASLWWPHKDHPSEEPERMTLSVTVPPGLQDVSNGRLVETRTEEDGWKTFVWEISYPINNYCVTINVGKYAHFSDEYQNADGETLTLDYYVLPENLEKARTHFEQTKTMLSAFEKYFGKYPFYRDGFKLIECPHTGMEHQSAIAYGNGYQGGYRGRASSEVGRKFDFIIIHEAAHEWWGNSVTMSDNADLWIHESFGAYAESLYVEDVFGYESALDYINGKRGNVKNVAPIIGVYGSNQSGHPDMYDKGQLVLNTLRSVIDDDPQWFAILKGIQQTFRHQHVDADTLIGYINEHTEFDVEPFFDQYMRHANLPILELELKSEGADTWVGYRWRADVERFAMPVDLLTSSGERIRLFPRTHEQTAVLKDVAPADLKVDERRFYIEVKR